VGAEKNGTGDIQPTDIVFNCPHCGKSLAIDYHAAGRKVKCADCGGSIDVPDPAAQRGPSREALELRIQELQHAVEKERRAAHQILLELKSVKARRRQLEKEHVEDLKRIETIREQVDAMRGNLDRISDILDRREKPPALPG